MWRRLQSVVPSTTRAVGQRTRVLATLARAGLPVGCGYVLPGQQLLALASADGAVPSAAAAIGITPKADTLAALDRWLRQAQQQPPVALQRQAAALWHQIQANGSRTLALGLADVGWSEDQILRWLHGRPPLPVCGVDAQSLIGLQLRLWHEALSLWLQEPDAMAAAAFGALDWAALLGMWALPASAVWLRVLDRDLFRGDDSEALLWATPLEAQDPGAQHAASGDAFGPFAPGAESWRIEKRFGFIRETQNQRYNAARALLTPALARRAVQQLLTAQRLVAGLVGLDCAVVGDQLWLLDAHRDTTRSTTKMPWRRRAWASTSTTAMARCLPLSLWMDVPQPWSPLLAGLYREQVLPRLVAFASSFSQESLPASEWLREIQGQPWLAQAPLDALLWASGGSLNTEGLWLTWRHHNRAWATKPLPVTWTGLQARWRAQLFDRHLRQWLQSLRQAEEDLLRLVDMDPRILALPALLVALKDLELALGSWLCAELVLTLITAARQPQPPAAAATGVVSALLRGLGRAVTEKQFALAQIDAGVPTLHAKPSNAPLDTAALYAACAAFRDRHGPEPVTVVPSLPRPPRWGLELARLQRQRLYLQAAWQRMVTEASSRLRQQQPDAPLAAVWWLSPRELHAALAPHAKAVTATVALRQRHDLQRRRNTAPAVPVAQPCLHGCTVHGRGRRRGVLYSADKLGHGPMPSADAMLVLPALRPAYMPLLTAGCPLLVAAASPVGMGAAWLHAAGTVALINLGTTLLSWPEGTAVVLDFDAGTVSRLPPDRAGMDVSAPLTDVNVSMPLDMATREAERSA